MKRNQRATIEARERAEAERLSCQRERISLHLQELEQVSLKIFDTPREAIDFARAVGAIEENWIYTSMEEEDLLQMVDMLPSLFPCYARYLRMEAISRDIARREKRAATAHRFEKLEARLSPESLIALELARKEAPRG
jgi:hypothetical protein